MSGLSSEVARERLTRQRRNELIREPTSSVGRLLARQLQNTMVLLLGGAAVVSAFIGEVADAIAIAAILVLNAAVGFFQEYRAERAVQALRALTAPKAQVRRDDTVVRVAATEVVVGDLLLLEAGDIVAADARLVESHQFTVNESALTGESVPVEKAAASAERTGTVFMGTSVATGVGAAEVVAIGMNTELGGIAQLLAAVQVSETPLQRRLAKVSSIWLRWRGGGCCRPRFDSTAFGHRGLSFSRLLSGGGRARRAPGHRHGGFGFGCTSYGRSPCAGAQVASGGDVGLYHRHLY